MVPELRPVRTSVRSPLLAALRRILRIVRVSGLRGVPPLAEAIEAAGEVRAHRLTRRRLLRNAGALGAGLSLPLVRPPLARAQRVVPRIAIIGAGIAGLTAAETLRRRGFEAMLY